jgi:hypothetical protein
MKSGTNREEEAVSERKLLICPHSQKLIYRYRRIADIKEILKKASIITC